MIRSCSLSNVNFFSCPKQGPNDEALNRVCMELRCAQRGLLCLNCAQKDHEDQQVKLLKDFIKDFDMQSSVESRKALSP